MTPSLDAGFAEARRRGFRLSNFFQLEDGSFRCNWITAEGVCLSFGNDPDPAVCIAKGLAHAEEDLIG